MERKDWTLIALAAAEGRPVTPAVLQKSLFLLGKKIPEVEGGGEYYRFVPYHYGPFDLDVYNDAEALEREGFARIRRSPWGWNEYSATELGLHRAAQVAQESPAATGYLSKIVAWARNLSFNALIRAIYQMYPEFKKNSVFVE